MTRLENKRRSGSADLTRLEKSDSSRAFFSCLDSDSDRKDFLDFFGFLDFRERSFAKMGGEGPIWGRIGRVIDWEHF